MKTLMIIALLACVAAAVFVSTKAPRSMVPTLADVRWGTAVNEVPFDSSTLAGKVVIVDEWGVRCPPCIAGLPKLAALAEAGRLRGLVVVGLERQQSSPEEILKFIRRADVRYPVRSGGSAPGGDGSLPRACVFGVDGRQVFNGHPENPAFTTAVETALGKVRSAK